MLNSWTSIQQSLFYSPDKFCNNLPPDCFLKVTCATGSSSWFCREGDNSSPPIIFDQSIPANLFVLCKMLMGLRSSNWKTNAAVEKGHSAVTTSCWGSFLIAHFNSIDVVAARSLEKCPMLKQTNYSHPFTGCAQSIASHYCVSGMLILYLLA